MSVAADLGHLSRNIASIKVHEHVCAAFDSPEQERAATRTFLEAGLKNGERCVYFAEDTDTFQDLESAPQGQATQSNVERKTGALILLPVRAILREPGVINSTGMLELLQELVSTAEGEGFRAIRVAIQLSGITDQNCGSLIEYETRLNRFFHRSNASGLCQYRRSHFDPSALKQCVLRHPLVIHEEVVCKNHWFIPPHVSNAARAEMDCLLDQLLEHHRHEIESLSMQAQKALLASAAHELKSPMQALDNVLFILAQQKNNDSATQRYLAIAQQELQHMKQVAVYTLSIGRDSGRPSTLKLADVLDNVLSFYDRKVEDKKIRVQRRYDSDGRIRALAGPLRQVFTNLIVNALEATPFGGQLTVHLYEDRDWSRPHRHGFRVVIADNGSGIVPHEREKVFEPFFTTKGEQGSGLGLWVSRGIVQRHGGTIRLRSSQGRGATGTVFSVFLPERIPEAS